MQECCIFQTFSNVDCSLSESSHHRRGYTDTRHADMWNMYGIIHNRAGLGTNNKEKYFLAEVWATLQAL